MKRLSSNALWSFILINPGCFLASGRKEESPIQRAVLQDYYGSQCLVTMPSWVCWLPSAGMISGLIWKIVPFLRFHYRWSFHLVVWFLFILLFARLFSGRNSAHPHSWWSSIPGIIGGKLEGTVQTRLKEIPKKGFSIILSCVLLTRIEHQYYDKGSKRTRTEIRKQVLWQDEQKVSRDKIEIGLGGISVPVSFSIPSESEETDLFWGEDQKIEWYLIVSAELPGVDYESEFEVPVFKVKEKWIENWFCLRKVTGLRRYLNFELWSYEFWMRRWWIGERKS